MYKLAVCALTFVPGVCVVIVGLLVSKLGG
jgi:hypothetical protein